MNNDNRQNSTINWDNGIYGNSTESIENTYFLMKRLLHI